MMSRVLDVEPWGWRERLGWRLLFRPRRLRAFNGETIEVAGAALASVETALADTSRIERLPAASLHRYWVTETADADRPWHVSGGTSGELVLCAETKPTADRLAELLDRLAAEHARTPKSPGYWNRGI